MNYQNPETQKKIGKAIKSLAVFGVLVLSLCTVFFSNTSSQSLPDCSAVSGTAKPGNNCLFYSLPLCQTVPSANYTIPPSNVLTTGQNHRVNCADLSDIPLCGQIDGSTSPGKNCVKECSDASFVDIPLLTRGQDYAVHNRDCIRFCDAPEVGITANPGVNCTGRKCHQLPNGTAPTTSNCNAMPCNLLTPDELNETKFADNTKKYCEGNNVKCFNFTQAQLPYVLFRATNTMCRIHECRATTETCRTFATDDVQQIVNKGQAFIDAYTNYISAGYSIYSTTLCEQVVCRPVMYRQYRCTPFADANPTVRNSECDSSGDGATCSAGYCYKTIDCNNPANAATPECTNTSVSDSGSIGSTEDSMRSWFYRPKPLSKALADGNGNLRSMNENAGSYDTNSLCYSKSQMSNNGWGSWFIDYFHDYLGMDSRSPGMCDVAKLGSRGNGYIYLCGVDGLAYNIAPGEAGFHKGYVRSEFVEGNATHRLVVCLRFENAMSPQKTCGSRECGITCFFGSCSEICGTDVCQELTVTDNNPKACEMDQTLFDSDPNRSCMFTVDTYIRVRAVKYGNRICTFIDLKGTFAYSPNYFNGTEKLANGTCISGTNVNGTCTGAKNTNDSKEIAHVWRTVVRIPYIQNNRPSGQPAGYLDKSGQLYPEQECIQTSFRLPPPRTYNLANLVNSANMFTPPLYILNARVKRGGTVSAAGGDQSFGSTDFHYPELEVRFGTTTQKLSLGIGFTGFETSGGDSAGSATIATTINDFNYSAEVFVRKELDGGTQEPTFCLYRRVRDENNAYIEPTRVGCVKRNLPEINNRTDKLITPAIDLRKVLIYADSANTFNSSKIVARYLSSTDVNSVNCSSSNTECAQEIKIANLDPGLPTCTSDIEKYTLCAQREECSKLNVECMQNEIDMHAAKIAGQSIDSFLSIRRSCNEVLLPMCNAKKGLPADAAATITNQNPGGTAPDPKYYGWFNEICLTYGFNTKLKNVVAYEIESGLRGKCLVDSSSPYLTDGNPATTCDEGGKAPNCLCVEAVDGVGLGNDQLVRKQTPHEAGLCIDMPLPQICPAIDYNLTPNPDGNDPDYTIQSLNRTFYNNSTGVHLSHQYRTEGKPAPNAIPLKGHAEFPVAVMGMNDVEGECKGYWRSATTLDGVTLTPKLSCLNTAGTAVWETNTRNACVRYSCQAATTAGPDVDGLYQGGYGSAEIGEDKGLSHGFGTWPQYTKTNDFLESVTSTGCITGFKLNGALANTSGGTVTGTNATTASLYNLITGYVGGTLATRQCNQLGQWQAPTNVCERIVCPAVSPPTPSGSGDSVAWDRWRNAGGATFPSANASRSTSRIQTESVSIGTCNNTLGFFQAPGGVPPKRECNHLGNWSAVINPCVTQCDAIINPDASSSNNGYSYWNQVLNVPLDGEVDGVLTTASGNNGCVTGYYPYPYPPLRDKYGQTFTISASGPYRTDSGGNASLMTIPSDLANDTRAATYPQRVCKSVITSGGAANVWTVPSSTCINNCVGYDLDERIGAGKTQHPTRNGTVTLNWPTTNFGQWAYIDNPTITQQDASQYFNGRTNNYYSMARYCNPATHKWDAPVPQCATNNGVITSANAAFNNPTPRLAINQAATGACIANYYRDNFNTAPLPSYSCVYKDGTNKIDEVYFNLSGGNNCKPYCTITNGDSFGESYYTGSTGFVEVGGTSQLTCVSGRGNAIIGGSRTGVPADCGRTTSDRTTSQPYVTCQSNGTWSTVFNQCSVCRNCNVGSPISGGTALNVRIQCCSAGSCYGSCDTDDSWHRTADFYDWLNGITLSNGSTIHNEMTVGGDTYCGWEANYPTGTAKIDARCNDNLKTVINLYQ